MGANVWLLHIPQARPPGPHLPVREGRGDCLFFFCTEQQGSRDLQGSAEHEPGHCQAAHPSVLWFHCLHAGWGALRTRVWFILQTREHVLSTDCECSSCGGG